MSYITRALLNKNEVILLEEASPCWLWLEAFNHSWRWSLWSLLTELCHWQEFPHEHRGMVYGQVAIVPCTKTTTKQLFQQETPLFALNSKKKVGMLLLTFF